MRSTNSFFATHPGALDAATVRHLGRVTVDSYPEGTTADPQTAAMARVTELNTIESLWGVPIVIGEMGYSNKVAVDDATQQAVLTAEFNALSGLPYLAEINYWVGAGTAASGGYTHIFSGSNGAWALRPAGVATAEFYGQEAQAAHLDTARFNWEEGTTQGWTSAGAVSGVAASRVQPCRGSGSLAVSVAAHGVGSIAVTTTLAGLGAGTPLAFHVWPTSGASPGAFTPYVVDASGATYRGAALVAPPGLWSTLAFTVPAGAVAPLGTLGLAVQTSGVASRFYLDSVDDATYLPVGTPLTRTATPAPSGAPTALPNGTGTTAPQPTLTSPITARATMRPSGVRPAAATLPPTPRVAH